MGDAPLPSWGRRARWTFRYVACPLYAVTLLIGWLFKSDLRRFLERHEWAAVVYVSSTTLVVALGVVSGLAWWAAEFVAGRREGRSARLQDE